MRVHRARRSLAGGGIGGHEQVILIAGQLEEKGIHVLHTRAQSVMAARTVLDRDRLTSTGTTKLT